MTFFYALRHNKFPFYILHCIDSFFAVYFCIGVTLSNFDEAHDIIYLLVLPVMVSLRPSE